MARLIQESGGERREKRIAGTITIGRSNAADFHIDDKTLSREHTQVYAQGNRYFVKDLESKNGTYLNGQIIRQPEALKSGDRIKVGPGVFVVAFDPGDAAPATAVARPAPAAPPAAQAPAAVRSRPRTERHVISAAGVHPFVKMVHTIFFIGVILVVAFFSSFVFKWVLDTFVPKP